MRALVRQIGNSFANALTAHPLATPIDVVLARSQHAAYVRALESLGFAAATLAPDERFPDGCFVEDGAVVAGGVCLITRPGAPSRRGEVDALAAALADWLPVEHMEAPATLDGGDCLRVGDRLFIGRSARSNDAGIARAAEVFAKAGIRVHAIALPPGILHLKCVCSPLGDGRILLAAGTLPDGAFADVPIVTVPADEAIAANCIALAGRALIADGFPAARDAIERAGLRTLPLSTSEIRKADGALTCLSILLPDAP